MKPPARRGRSRAAAAPAEEVPVPVAEASVLQESRQLNQSVMSTVSTASKRSCLGQNSKKEIWDFIVDLLEDVQRGNINRKSAYKKFIERFYQEKNEEMAKDWQKYFIQSLWRISILIFSAPNSPHIRKTLQFVYEVLTNAGTEEEKVEVQFPFRTNPAFVYALRLAAQSHGDKRPLVRLRVLEVMDSIYAKHNTHPLILEHPYRHKECLKVVRDRIRDKHAPAREMSAKLLQYFVQDKSVVKDLKYYARYDPSPDVKKMAIRSLGHSVGVKPGFFAEHAFDSSPTVRAESFSVLIDKPMQQLYPQMRCKVLMWGLMADPRIQKIVVQKMIPSWMAQCNNSVIDFLKASDVGSQDFSVSQTILSKIYPNDFTETFDLIDLGFLNEQRVIPVETLSIEATMFWMFLIKTFSKVRYHAEKILPTFDVMMTYVKEIIQVIHVEHEAAIEMDRDEDGTLLLCLVNVLPVFLFIGLEEGNRRLFEKQLKDILLDNALDDVILVREGVRLMKSAVDPNSFADKMTGIFQETFEPSEEREQKSRTNRSRRSRSRSRSIGRLSNADVSNKGPATSDSIVKEEPQIIPSDSQEVPEEIPFHLTEEEKKEIKEKVCDLALQRLRLEAEKNNAAKAQQFLAAHRLQVQMDELEKEENELNAKLDTAEQLTAGSTNRHKSMPLEQISGPSGIRLPDSGQSGRRAASLISEMSVADDIFNRQGRSKSMDELIEDDAAPASQANTTLTERRMALAGENILKGFVMLGEFLTLHPKLTPFVRQLYENFLTQEFLFDTNPRVRQLSLSLLAMIGLIEPDDKRRVMGCLLSALISDKEYDVNCSAFKGTVDMLLKYKVEEFKFSGNGDKLFHNLPAEFNDVNSTAKTLETMFIPILDGFAKEPPMDNLQCETIKAKGWMKLLQASRITDHVVVSELICMWTSKRYAGSAIPYHFGCWLPVYTKTSVDNARLVAKGFLRSLISIVTTVNNSSPLFDADIAKMSDFIIPLLSPTHLNFDEGDQVHQEFALMLFQDILAKPIRTGNLALIKITSKLSIVNQNQAYEINHTLINIFLKILASPHTPTIGGLKMALKVVSKRLQKQFDGLEDLPNPLRVFDELDEEERRERGAFSDDDSLLSNESIVPDSVKNRSVRSTSAGLSDGNETEPEAQADNGDDSKRSDASDLSE